MTPDTPNLADAILIALSEAGWIGKLVPKGTEQPPPARPKRRPAGERAVRYPLPAGLVLPPGVAWSSDSNRCVVRVSMARRMKHVCMLPAERAELAGELVELARELRDAGADLDEIKRRVRERIER